MKIRSLLLFTCGFVMAAGFTIADLKAQGVTLPQVSQKAKVSQTVGISEITVVYSRPKVNDREIWGKVVPYGMTNLGFGTAKEGPWRAGANENTVIKFSHDTKVEGKDIAAGKYGLHMEVFENGDVTVIFSNNHTSWGSFFYDPAEDALRVTVKSEEAPHHEYLTFDFLDVQPNSAVCALTWEKKRIPFKIELDVPTLVMANLKNELRTTPGFNWQNWNQAANYAMNNTEDFKQAMAWIESGINTPFIGQKNFTTLSTKSQILSKMGKADEAEKVMTEALADPTANASNYYGYGRQLIGQDKDKEALEIFKTLNKKWPGHWLAPHGLARGYSAMGDFKKALEYEKVAYEKAPDGSKQFLAGYIKTLEEGKDFN